MSIGGNWRRSEVDRRQFLGLAGAGAGAAALAANGIESRALARPTFPAYPFTLGVASGDPHSDGVVLWTRLAPKPLEGGGMPDRKVPVRWEVARDERFRQVVRRGNAVARPDFAHSVHVEVDGLRPRWEYFYRFKAGSEISPVGRTKTAPSRHSSPRRLAFAFVSCQHYEQGFYTAYRHLAEEELDLVLHLGDYIYEGGPSQSPNALRRHEGPEPTGLEAYRNRQALYRTDRDLQAAHAAFPFAVTWDDHEVENNYADGFPQDEAARPDDQETPEFFLPRRAAAYRAYYEHMPLRRRSIPRGPNMRLYRRLTYGDMAQFSVLDTRQYRDNQVCDPENEPGAEVPCAESRDPDRSLPGFQQEGWLKDNLRRSRSRWNVIAQQVFMAQRDFDPEAGERLSMDAWDGYVASRDRLLSFVERRRIRNPVVLTGDVHSNWVNDLKSDFDDESSRTVGSELVGTSISTGGDGMDTRPDTAQILAENPHIKFFNGQRGYVRCRLSRRRWVSDFRVLPFVTRPGAPISTRARFVIENGRPGAQRVS